MNNLARNYNLICRFACQVAGVVGPVGGGWCRWWDGRRAVVDVVVSLIFAGWVPHDPVSVPACAV